MRTYLFGLLLLTTFYFADAQTFSATEIQAWEEQAARVEIIRDDWGIPHIYGPTDADAVFGMLYAQCEDDFPRVERNYLEFTGQLAAQFGERYLYQDLRTRMWMDSTFAKQQYAEAPEWLQELCQAFANGVNYYLYKHPSVKPQVIKRYEPWMPLAFSEGSIGGDTYWISLEGLEAFYADDKMSYVPESEVLDEREPTGSNGFAISKRLAVEGKSLLLINPHTSFYFRSEQQVVSDEGLNVYGAVTWGQFFIYQGFNEDCGWMHTSTKADAIDEYLETITERDGKYYYRYGTEERPVTEKEITIAYQTAEGMKNRTFTTYSTHHGPIVRKEGEHWMAYRIMNRPADALQQSYGRTKAKGYGSFRKTMKLRTNSSNNTVFADAKGNIAYWHGNFIPERDPSVDSGYPLDGSDPATDWGELHSLKEMVQIRNPKNGWLQNCNGSPFSVAGTLSPIPTEYPAYMAPELENYRQINAVEVLKRYSSFTLDSLISAANDPHLSIFDELIPALEGAYQEVADGKDRDLLSARQMLNNWDGNYGVSSVPTTLAIFWAERLRNKTHGRVSTPEYRSILPDEWMIQKTSPQEKIDALKEALVDLESFFGSWQTPWGVVNRFQRISPNIESEFNDSRPSIPVGFASAWWGSLASMGTQSPEGSMKRYGVAGNSFVAAVSFGKRLEARAIVSGGQSANPRSPHFKDQAQMYAKCEFRDVYFYKEDVVAHAEQTYSPGEDK